MLNDDVVVHASIIYKG